MEILREIVEAIGMIDAQAIDFAVADELQNKMMRDFKDRFILHS